MLITAFCEFLSAYSTLLLKLNDCFVFVLEFHQLEGTNSAATMEKTPLFPQSLVYIFMRPFDDVIEVG